MRRSRCRELVLVAACLLQPPGEASAQEAFPDLDLRLDCPRRLEVPGQEAPAPLDWVFPASVVLLSQPNGAEPSSGVRAWSLSLRPSEGATIVEATIAGTDVPGLFGVEAYEMTELTTGPDNSGAVSAVILSLFEDLRLPLSSELVLLRLRVEVPIPDSGCSEHRVDFVDGLVGSGQPVKNILTCGEGATRRDDGGVLDNDADGYDVCALTLCRARAFLRGDTNGDGAVNLSDALFALSHLFQGAEKPACLRSADIVPDDALNLSDVVYLLNHLFRGGPALAAPYPACGLPLEASSFPCEDAPGCLK